MKTIQGVKGTQDFYPEQLAFRNWLTNHMRAAAQLFGYQEWDAPILEPFELYAAKSGDELVNEQAFVMEDRGGRKIVLRPELTPSLARMVAQKQLELGKPIRWFSVGPMWRYEQPQRGRSREFWQWNVDLLGADSPLADAELITVACHLLLSLGLDEHDFVIKINSRIWNKDLLTQLGIADDLQPAMLRAIDRIDKMTQEKFVAYVKQIGLTTDQADQLLKMLTPSPTPDKALTGDDSIFSCVMEHGLSKYVEYDPRVVRGLDYYTGIVFEIRDRKSVLRAIGGGGRYANLVEQVGGHPISGVGFAIGDMPTEELLREVAKYPENVTIAPTVLVSIFDAKHQHISLEIAQNLRKQAIPTELFIGDGKIPNLEKQLKYADHKNIPFVVIIGSQESEHGKVMLKNLVTRSQQLLDPDKLAHEIRK